MAGIFLCGLILILNLKMLFITAVLLLGPGCDSREIILEGLSQREANVVLVMLSEKSIPAQKTAKAERKDTLYSISVDKKYASQALKLLVDNQLPKNFRVGLKDVFPPGSSGIIPTKGDETARLSMALQGEVEDLLKLIPGIVDAKVVLSQNTTVVKEIVKRSASVTVLFLPVNQNAPMSDEEIRTLVASAVDNLPKENVTIVQKALAPAAYIDVISKNQPETKSQAYGGFTTIFLFCLTLLALLLAAYAMARPRWLKRKLG